jgi:hypothetical protein
MVLAVAVGCLAGASVGFRPGTRVLRELRAPGIIAFELAGAPERSAAILDAWGPTGRAASRRLIVVDYVFIFGYSTTLAIALSSSAALAGRRTGPLLADVTRLAGWGAIVAGLLDVVENVALLRVLGRGPARRLTRTAQVCATVKFALVGTSAAWLLFVVTPIMWAGSS